MDGAAGCRSPGKAENEVVCASAVVEARGVKAASTGFDDVAGFDADTGFDAGTGFD
jgi:hypothetical protein